jgi:hypothetical protein
MKQKSDHHQAIHFCVAIEKSFASNQIALCARRLFVFTPPKRMTQHVVDGR